MIDFCAEWLSREIQNLTETHFGRATLYSNRHRRLRDFSATM